MTEHVLLAEDTARDVEITLDCIAQSHLPVEVTVVSDGEEALDYLKRRGKYRLRSQTVPSMILLDVKMPRVGGFEVLRELQRDPELSRIPVLILTASRQEQDLLSAYDLKADGYLIKPLNYGQFEAAMRTARAAAASRSA